MSLNKKDVEDILNAALGPLRTQNAALQSEITSLRTQISSQTTDPWEAERAQRALILREEREAAERRIRERLEQQNITVDADEEVGFVGNSLFEKIKVSDLDEFDGTDVHSFFLSVDAALAQFSPRMVAGVMARNLKGVAKIWFQNLSEVMREAILSNANVFKDSLRQEFEEDKAISRQLARDRKWQVQKEPIMTYYYEKMKMIANAFKGIDSSEQCLEIRDGLPDDLKLLVRTTMAARPNLDHLRKELKTLEQDYLANRRKRPFTPQQTFPPANQQSLVKHNRNPVKAEPGRRPPSLRDSFNPKFIGQSPNPSNPSQMIRTYTVPDGSGRVLMLNRPCRTCGGNHFDFEQVHAHFVELDDNDSYVIQYTPQSQQTYSVFTPQLKDPMIPIDNSAYPSWEMSNEDYAYQMLRADPEDHCFIPDDQRIQDISSPISTQSSQNTGSPKN